MGKKAYLKYLSMLFAMVLLVALFRPSYVRAASASIWFEQAGGEAVAGSEIKIQMCISTDVDLGDFEGTISYNDDVLEYISGPACITGGGGVLKVADINASESWDTRKYVMTFKALKRGTSLIQMINNPVAYEYSTEEAMSCISSVFTLEVGAAPESSDNAKLSLMKINPGSLTPSFSSDVYEYSCIVDENTDRLIVSAIPEDLASVVTVNGHSGLKMGSNTVTVLVTAPSGTKLTYSIHAVKEAKVPEQEITIPPEEPEISSEKSIEWRFGLASEHGLTLIQGQYNYIVRESADVKIPSGYMKTKIIIDGITLSVYGKEDDRSDEFLLLILENEAGETGVYRYDRVEKTIQRYVEAKTVAAGSQGLKEQELLQDAIDLSKYHENTGKLSMLTAVLSCVCVLLVIVVIYLILKLKADRDELD